MSDSMPQKSPYFIQLSSSERSHLKSTARKYTSPYFSVVRAKVILLADQGLQNDQIADLDRVHAVRDRALREVRARRRHGAAVAVIDIDRFRLVTETLGHAAGDELLVEVARRIAKMSARSVSRFTASTSTARRTCE